MQVYYIKFYFTYRSQVSAYMCDTKVISFLAKWVQILYQKIYLYLFFYFDCFIYSMGLATDRGLWVQSLLPVVFFYQSNLFCVTTMLVRISCRKPPQPIQIQCRQEVGFCKLYNIKSSPPCKTVYNWSSQLLKLQRWKLEVYWTAFTEETISQAYIVKWYKHTKSCNKC